MTDAGMSLVGKMAARHPSLRVLNVSSECRCWAGTCVSYCLYLTRSYTVNHSVTDVGYTLLLDALRTSDMLHLDHLHGIDPTKFDDTLPPDVRDKNFFAHGNPTVLSHYRAQSRIRRRVKAVAVLRRAWRHSTGQPRAPCDDSRAAALAHVLQLRRLCRTRDDAKVVEPFGHAVVAYL